MRVTSNFINKRLQKSIIVIKSLSEMELLLIVSLSLWDLALG